MLSDELRERLEKASTGGEFSALGFSTWGGQVVDRHPDLDDPSTVACRFWLLKSNVLELTIILYDLGNDHYRFVGEYTPDSLADLIKIS